MKTHYYVIIIFVFLFEGCASWQNVMVSKGDQNDAVQNAIIDFLHSASRGGKDTVFSISIENISDEVIGVSIFGSHNKLLPNTQNKIGTNLPNFPTRHFEKDGKLFYWYDPNSKITSDLVSILSKHKLIDSLDVNGFVGIPVEQLEDHKKATHYYYCKCNLRKYVKIRSVVAMGYYAPPQVDCDCR